MKTWRPWTDAEETTMHRLLDEGVSYATIAGQIGRSAVAVKERARIQGRCKKKPPNWTRATENELLGLLDLHHSYEDIARRLGRTREAILARLSKLKATPASRRGYSVTRVSKLMGVDTHTAAWWVTQGWLRVHRTGVTMQRGEVKVAEHDDLTEFLADERYWCHWTPARITDSALREWANELRDGVKFLTTGQAADLLCLTHSAVNQLVRAGRIKARKSGANWLIRSDDVHYQLRAHRPKRSWTDTERAFVRHWWGKRPATWTAAHLDRSDSSVCALAYRMGLPKVGRGCWKRLGGAYVAVSAPSETRP